MRLQQRSPLFVKAILSVLILLSTPAVPHAGETSCLWSVTSDHNTVYLLGSVHVLKQENYPLHDTIYQAFDAARHLVFEVNLDEMASPLTQVNYLEERHVHRWPDVGECAVT